MGLTFPDLRRRQSSTPRKRDVTAAMLVSVCEGEAAGGACYPPRLAPMFWNGAFRAVLSKAIRTGIADLRGLAAADEPANRKRSLDRT